MGINATQVYSSYTFIFKYVYMRLPRNHTIIWALLNVLETLIKAPFDKSGQVSYYHSHHCFGTGFSRNKIEFILESWFIGSVKPKRTGGCPSRTIGAPRKVVRKKMG
jgi:hypothetical protein